MYWVKCQREIEVAKGIKVGKHSTLRGGIRPDHPDVPNVIGNILISRRGNEREGIRVTRCEGHSSD